MNSNDFLEVADRIGQRLVRQAIWDGAACNWEIQASDRTDSSRSLTQKAAPTLYQGTSGIVWFLAELARVTGDAELARTARGGLRHALISGQELSATSFGFHTGRLGIAWVAARIAKLLGEESYAEDAWQIVEPLLGNESQDRGLDVIGGAAGAVPALLDLTRMLGREELKESARRLGEHLIERAHREPVGWSWAMMSDTVIRHLNGLAHGAAGAGLALLELARATGETRFRFAAEMAFLYERHFFDAEASNWPDLRNSELGNYLFYEGRREDLVRHAREGRLPPNKTHFMAAWCHGSPGIGLSRLRAFELTGQDLYRQETEAAVVSTLESITGPSLDHHGFSLCHGIAGNSVLPLIAAEQLDEPAWLQPVLDAAVYGWERYEKAGVPWPCGTVNEVSDPSLMVGEAGIGMFYLQLARPETPSPLLLLPQHQNPAPTSDREAFAALALESADEFFAVSRQATERLTGSPVSTPSVNGQPLLEAPASVLHQQLQQRIGEASGELRELLDDAFQGDRERWEAARALDDFTAEFVHGLTHRPWEALEPRQTRFQCAANSRLITVQRPWKSWLSSSASKPPEEDEIHVLLYRRDHRIHEQPVGLFAALLLGILDRPMDLGTLVDGVAAELDSATDPVLLTAKILPQLEALYRAGFVVEIA